MAGKSKYPNSGTLGRNKRKTQDNHPEYSGQAEIDGVDYWISAWIKEGQDGKFFSLAFKPKDQQQGSSGGGKSQNSRQQPDDNDFDGAPF